MSHHLVELRNVSYSYPDGTEALKDVSFRITHGNAVGLIGPNGAGKSTLLLHLNGYLRPTAGEVRIGDVALTEGALAAARRAVGMVFQDADDQLFMPSVFEDVAFGPRNFGVPPGEIEGCVMRALDQVGLARLRDRPAHRLSAGEKRAVAIATVLAASPDILVMDEPSSNLDPRARRRLIELLLSFQHTRIVATHDLELVVETCPQVMILDGGRIVAQGSTETLLSDEALMLAHGLERPHILRHRHPH